MIPKIIHYCWLSMDPFPPHIQHCIDTWKRILPDYDFILWDRKRFPKHKSIWVDQAFEFHKYAFAADYIRLYALLHYGGIYLDCDVEVLRPFDDFLGLPTMICWQRDVSGLEVAAFGVEPGLPWVKDCLARYENRPFIGKKGFFDAEVLPEVVEFILRDKNYPLVDVQNIEEACQASAKGGIPVFPSRYFSPKSYLTKTVELTPDSYCIHHFDGSWKTIPFYTKLDIRFGKLIHKRHFFFLTNCVRYFNFFIHRHQ